VLSLVDLGYQPPQHLYGNPTEGGHPTNGRDRNHGKIASREKSLRQGRSADRRTRDGVHGNSPPTRLGNSDVSRRPAGQMWGGSQVAKWAGFVSGKCPEIGKTVSRVFRGEPQVWACWPVRGRTEIKSSAVSAPSCPFPGERTTIALFAPVQYDRQPRLQRSMSRVCRS
jgi:hypothetical protein